MFFFGFSRLIRLFSFIYGMAIMPSANGQVQRTPAKQRYIVTLILFTTMLIYSAYGSVVNLVTGITTTPIPVLTYSASIPLYFQFSKPDMSLHIPIFPFRNGSILGLDLMSLNSMAQMDYPLYFTVEENDESCDLSIQSLPDITVLPSSLSKFIRIFLDENVNETVNFVSSYTNWKDGVHNSSLFLCSSSNISYSMNFISFTLRTVIALDALYDVEDREMKSEFFLRLLPQSAINEFRHLFVNQSSQSSEADTANTRKKRSIDRDIASVQEDPKYILDFSSPQSIGCYGSIVNESLYPSLWNFLQYNGINATFNHIVSNDTHLFICLNNVVLFVWPEQSVIYHLLHQLRRNYSDLSSDAQLQHTNALFSAFPNAHKIAFYNRDSYPQYFWRDSLPTVFNKSFNWTDFLMKYKAYDDQFHLHLRAIPSEDLVVGNNSMSFEDFYEDPSLSEWRKYFLKNWLHDNTYETDYAYIRQNATHFIFHYDIAYHNKTYTLSVRRHNIDLYVKDKIFNSTYVKKYHFNKQTTQLVRLLEKEFRLVHNMHQSTHDETVITSCIRMYFLRLGLKLPEYDYLIHNATHVMLYINSPLKPVRIIKIQSAYLLAIAIEILITSDEDPHQENPVFLNRLMDILNEWPVFDRSDVLNPKSFQPLIIQDLLTRFNFDYFDYDAIHVFHNVSQFIFYKFLPYIKEIYNISDESIYYLMDYFGSTLIHENVDDNSTIYMFYSPTSQPTSVLSSSLLDQITRTYPGQVLNHFLVQHGIKCKYAFPSSQVYNLRCESNNKSEIVQFSREMVIEFFVKSTIPQRHYDEDHHQFDVCMLELFSSPPGFLYPLDWNETYEKQASLVNYYDNNHMPFYSISWFSTAFRVEQEEHPDFSLWQKHRASVLYPRFQRNLTKDDFNDLQFYPGLVVPSPITEMNDIYGGRMKRGLGNWFGTQLHSCCNVLTTNEFIQLTATNHAIRDQFQRNRDALIENHQSLLSLEQNVQTFNHFYDDAIRTVRNDMLALSSQANDNTYSIFESIYQYSLIMRSMGSKLNMLAVDSIMTQCHLGLLSEALVPRKDLLKRLQTLINEFHSMQSQNFQLLFPLKYMEKYYQFSLLHCHSSSDTITAKVMVPLFNKDNPWTLHRVHNLPFQLEYQKRICHYTTLPDFVFLNMKTEEIRLLDPVSYGSCVSGNSKELCFVPQHQTVFNEQLNCLKHLIFHPNSADIEKSCSFVCKPAPSPIVYQMANIHQFVVTNVQNITVRCTNVLNESHTPGLNTHYSLTAGSLLIDINCHCDVLIGKTVLITAPFPCSIARNDMNVIKIIPRSYINLTEIDDFSTRVHISTTDISSVLKRHLNDTPFYFESQLQNLTTFIDKLSNDTIPDLFDWRIEQINEYYFAAMLIAYFLIFILLYLVIRILFNQSLIIERSRVNLIEQPCEMPRHSNIVKPKPKRSPLLSFRKKRPAIQIEAQELVRMLQTQMPVASTSGCQLSGNEKLYPTLTNPSY